MGPTKKREKTFYESLKRNSINPQMAVLEELLEETKANPPLEYICMYYYEKDG